MSIQSRGRKKHSFSTF